jgi:hypothetical protein
MLVDIVVGAKDRLAALNAIRQWDAAHMQPGIFRWPVNPHVGKENEAGIRLYGVPEGVLAILKERGICFRRYAQTIEPPDFIL